MSALKRYELEDVKPFLPTGLYEIVPNPLGDWVTFEDAHAIEQERDALKAALIEWFRCEDYWNNHNYDPKAIRTIRNEKQAALAELRELVEGGK